MYLTAWDLKNGFIERFGPHTTVSWNQLAQRYVMVHQTKTTRIAEFSTNLRTARNLAKFYA